MREETVSRWAMWESVWAMCDVAGSVGASTRGRGPCRRAPEMGE